MPGPYSKGAFCKVPECLAPNDLSLLPFPGPSFWASDFVTLTHFSSEPDFSSAMLPFTLWVIAVIVALFALISALPELTSVHYRVHTSGAILVTGASTGIGRHAAEALALRGWIIFAGVRSAAAADSIRAAGIEGLLPLQIEVTSAASRARALADVMEELHKRGGLPFVALVNNAGIFRGNLPLEFEPETMTRDVMEANFFGAVGTTQAFLPLLRASEGRLIMMSSIAGVVSPTLTLGTYSASKWALEAVSDALRRELAPAGVSVSVIEPGSVKTELARSDDVSAGALTASREAYPWIPDMLGTIASSIMNGDSPQVTTDAIVDAIESATPSTRYIVATIVDGERRIPASAIAWLEWLLPDRLMDVIVLAGVKRSAPAKAS